MRLVLTDRGRATLAAGATLVVAGAALGFEELTRVGMVAVTVVLLAALLVVFFRPHVEVEAEVGEGALTTGQVTTLPLRLRARRRCPAARLSQPLPSGLGGGSIEVLTPALRVGSTFEVTLTVMLAARGRHEIPPCTITREDPFGFAERVLPAGSSRTITVLPPAHDLGTLPSRSADLHSEGVSARTSPLPGEEYGSIRSYQVGDDLRRIHWPATAHRGELMTRHDERTTARHALLVLDPRLVDRSFPDVLEWGVEMLASAALTLDRAGMSLDLLTGSATLLGGTDERSRREEIMLALATTPVVMRPPRLQVAVEDPFVGLVRDAAARAGLVVLVTGVRDAETRDLLLTLPPGSQGLACLVTPGQVDAALVDVARQAGWAATPCTPRTGYVDAWRAMTGDAVPT